MNYVICTLLLFFLSISRIWATEQILVIIENDKNQPGQAKIYFSHLGKWLATDANGIIKLPMPHHVPDMIKVRPTKPDIYGGEWRRRLPIEDGAVGIVSLRAIPVTVAIQAKAEEFMSNQETAKAATAYALTAARVAPTMPVDAVEFQQKAFRALGVDLLGVKFEADVAYVKFGQEIRASPRLVSAVANLMGEATIPSDGAFKVDDFKRIAGLTSLAPIVSEFQKQHFASKEK